MSIHINAPVGAVAETVLLPGDPLRAKFIAETYLQDVSCYNEVRGMLGFTGTYKGRRLSVQGTGMGIPSIAIYASELMAEYGVKNLMRVGTCGAMQAHIRIRDLVLAQSASTDSSFNRNVFGGWDYAPTADFRMLRNAYDQAQSRGVNSHVGNVFSSDAFYRDDKTVTDLFTKYGVLAVEMETTGLYTLAAKYGANALSILTVSDHLITGEVTTPQERQTTFQSMMEIALETAITL
jgi:purine-nucleoside phosphorylase